MASTGIKTSTWHGWLMTRGVSKRMRVDGARSLGREEPTNDPGRKPLSQRYP